MTILDGTPPIRQLDLRAGQLMGGRPHDTALVSSTGSTSYAALADAVDQQRARLGSTRRLVLLEAANDEATVITLLGALAGRHPVGLLAPGDLDRHPHLIDTYRPDVVVPASGEPSFVGATIRAGSAHDLHPDLALLLSTSGSTGSPKLVRLSHDNLLANARSISDYLAIGPDDTAITSLPLHYCYGLSVLTSHLVAGAGVALTGLSVTEQCFWDLAATAGATSFAGVPYTFDLLEASGFEHRDLPRLRYVTQAGGRLAPEQVVRWSETGRERGWDLVVMYGATEATARMAYLPPDRARERPTAIGVAVPGGSLRLQPVAGLDHELGSGVGELIYTGPNVMMGYAEAPADLARGRELIELATGDLGRLGDDGLWEVVGRLKRHAKVFGLRIDLDRVEEGLGQVSGSARVVTAGDVLHVFTTRHRGAARLRAQAAGLAGLPPTAVVVHVVAELPLTASGKPDHGCLASWVPAVAPPMPTPPPTRSDASAEGVRDLYAHLLGRPAAGLDDSFASLGGDSLSYVEASTALATRLGDLPVGWAQLTARELAALAARAPRPSDPRSRGRAGGRGRAVDVSAALRAVAIMLVLITHTDIVLVPGGAHLLLAVAGFNLARFNLAVPGRGPRTRRLLGSLAQVAGPAAVLIGLIAVLRGTYRPETALFLNALTGSDRWTVDWQFWFLEVLVWGVVGLAALLAVPVVDRLQRRDPFAFAAVLLVGCLAVRFAWTGVEAGATERYTVGVVLWCVVLGMMAATATRRWQRMVVVAATLVSVVGFFGDRHREAVLILGVLALLHHRPIWLPPAAASVVRVLAGASLWIYLTHWQVYPPLEDAGHPYLAVLASLAVGIACWLAHARVLTLLRRVGASAVPSRR